MDAQFWAFALALLGFILIAMEFFVPSAGMIALSCAFSFVGSIVCAHSAWYDSSPKLFWGFTLSLGVLIPSFLVFFLKMLERTSLGKNLLLPKPDPKEVVPYQEETAQLERLVGRIGTALTQMAPGGMVRVENERLHAFSEGLLILQGESVEVIAVRGTRILVRKTLESASVAPPVALASDAVNDLTSRDHPPMTPQTPAQDPLPLDFDIPQD
ncbi:MAG: hypothetical protein DWH91_11305 [Planctomycetota bacterium]|nr:MAG: hypothetical protein DWH91_11305 [Planctomycetota bacterium]